MSLLVLLNHAKSNHTERGLIWKANLPENRLNANSLNTFIFFVSVVRAELLNMLISLNQSEGVGMLERRIRSYTAILSAKVPTTGFARGMICLPLLLLWVVITSC